jgi:hypothetical protein
MGCVNYINKQHLLSTVNLHNYQPNGCKVNLYREDYCIYGMGALGSDLNSVYLTDSATFRVYIGTYDNEDEHIIPKCKDDIIIVKKNRQHQLNARMELSKSIGNKNLQL